MIQASNSEFSNQNKCLRFIVLGTTREHYSRWSVLCYFLLSLLFQLTVFLKERKINIIVMNQLLLNVEIKDFFRKKYIVKLIFLLSICSFSSNKVVDSRKTPNYCSQVFRSKTFIACISQVLSNLVQVVALK